jgi:hypothetical protein
MLGMGIQITSAATRVYLAAPQRIDGNVPSTLLVTCLVYYAVRSADLAQKRPLCVTLHNLY